MKLGKATLLAAACLGLLGMANAARADSIEVVAGPSIAPSSVNLGDFTYSYTIQNSVNVTNPNEIVSGDFFVLVDFAGYVGLAGALPLGWSLYSSAGLAATPAGPTILIPGFGYDVPTLGGHGALITDDPSIPDLVFVYSGGIEPMLPTFFKIDSTFSGIGDGTIVGSDHQFNGSVYVPAVNADPYIAPGNGSTVPVPAAAWMGTGTLAAMGVLAAMRRRKMLSA